MEFIAFAAAVIALTFIVLAGFMISALIEKSEHFFLDNVGLFAGTLNVQIGILQNRRIDQAITIIISDFFDDVLDRPPILLILRQNIPHASDGDDFFSASARALRLACLTGR